jgi:hypothetical protein
MLTPWNQEENLGRNSEKIFLISSPGEGGFCTLEPKHDRRMATIPKTVLGSGPGEDGFSSSENKHDKKGAKTKVVCFDEGVTRTTATPRKTVLDSSPDKNGFRTSGTNNDRRTALWQKLSVSTNRLQEKVTNQNPHLGLSPGEDMFCSLPRKLMTEEDR